MAATKASKSDPRFGKFWLVECSWLDRRCHHSHHKDLRAISDATYSLTEVRLLAWLREQAHWRIVQEQRTYLASGLPVPDYTLAQWVKLPKLRLLAATLQLSRPTLRKILHSLEASNAVDFNATRTSIRLKEAAQRGHHVRKLYPRFGFDARGRLLSYLLSRTNTAGKRTISVTKPLRWIQFDTQVRRQEFRRLLKELSLAGVLTMSRSASRRQADTINIDLDRLAELFPKTSTRDKLPPKADKLAANSASLCTHATATKAQSKNSTMEKLKPAGSTPRMEKREPTKMENREPTSMENREPTGLDVLRKNQSCSVSNEPEQRELRPSMRSQRDTPTGLAASTVSRDQELKSYSDFELEAVADSSYSDSASEMIETVTDSCESESGGRAAQESLSLCLPEILMTEPSHQAHTRKNATETKGKASASIKFHLALKRLEILEKKKVLTEDEKQEYFSLPGDLSWLARDWWYNTDLSQRLDTLQKVELLPLLEVMNYRFPDLIRPWDMGKIVGWLWEILQKFSRERLAELTCRCFLEVLNERDRNLFHRIRERRQLTRDLSRAIDQMKEYRLLMAWSRRHTNPPPPPPPPTVSAADQAV